MTSPLKLVLPLGIAALALASGRAFADPYRTLLFNARVKLNNDRTATIDETIQVSAESGAQGSIQDLVIAHPGPNDGIQYLVSKATLTSRGQLKHIDVRPNDRGDLVAYAPADDLVGNAELHVNYSVLGAFADHSGGGLGRRSTVTWNVIPANWSSPIDTSTVEIQYPSGATPVLVSAGIGPRSNNLTVEKRLNNPFSGSTAVTVDDNATGATFHVPQGITASQGLRLIVALPTAGLSPAPDHLTAPAPTVPPPAPAVNRATGPSGGAKPAPVASNPPVRSSFLLLLPFLAPVLFYLLNAKRFTWAMNSSYPSSIVPAGVGPAEAGYLLEGKLKQRHLHGCLALLGEYGVLKPGASPHATKQIGPVEASILAVLNQKGAFGPQEARAAVNKSLHDLDLVVRKSIDSLNLLDPSAARAKAIPAVFLALAIILATAYTASAGMMPALGAGIIAAGAGAALLWHLSPLTKNGAATRKKVVGLKRFLASEAKEFARQPDHLSELRPYAISLGVIADSVPADPRPPTATAAISTGVGADSG
jgi:hypothetical protein